MRNFLRSHYGKNCIAIQQQETAAEMVGINVLKTKLIALMISAFYAGVAGGLFSFFATYLAPTNFSEAKSDDLLAAVVLGGINTLSGPLLAAAILVVLPEALRFLAIWRLVFYGAAFVAIMQFKPEGLMGYREISFKWVGSLYKRVRGKGA
jgi:branched-chain amino acid transport system permease protein